MDIFGKMATLRRSIQPSAHLSWPQYSFKLTCWKNNLSQWHSHSRITIV